MAVIRKIKLPNEASARDIGALSSNVIYDGDSGITTTLNDKIQSIFTAIGDINSFEIAIVTELPATGEDHTIYFVPESQGSTTHNEYMYIDNQWELIGTTTIDLSNYLQKSDITIAQGLTTGIPAATITVGTTTTTIYSEDGSKWNNVSLSKSMANLAADSYIPQLTSATATYADLAKATNVPANYSIAKYDNHAMLHSATPTAGDKSNKVATTSFVADAITTTVTPVAALTTGVTIGTIDVSGVTTTFYAPEATSPVQSDWTQTTDTELDFIKNKPAIWDSEDYTVPSGQTYGDSTTKAIGAVALNLKTNSAKGNYSVSEGYQPTGTRKVTINGVSTTLPYGASGESSHAEGYYTIASGRYSHTEGQNTVAHGSHSHAEGFYAIASGNYSHAEGEGSVASGDCSHAEGNSSTASDASSHAEGNSTVASGVSSHAEGYGSKASSYYSHAEGYQTIAQRKSQHVFGEYNVSDTTGSASARGTYVEIVGNGTSSSARSNARTLDWSGNEWLAGKATVANLTPTAAGDLTSKQYVDNSIAGITPSAISATSTLSEGTEIGSIDINGNTTTFYAPEDTKVKQNDITGSTTGMRPVLLSAQANHKGTIADESLKSDTLLFYKVSDSLIITRSSSDDFDGRFAVTDSAGRPQAEILSYKEGTTTQTGIGLISAGNNQPSGVAGNAKGALIIYGEGNWQNVVYALDNRTTDDANHNYVNYLPMVDQAVLAAGVTTGVGSSTVPVYMASTGELLACTLPTPTTYTMSMTGPTINLLADGVAASTITLPIWDGTLD